MSREKLSIVELVFLLQILPFFIWLLLFEPCEQSLAFWSGIGQTVLSGLCLIIALKSKQTVVYVNKTTQTPTEKIPTVDEESKNILAHIQRELGDSYKKIENLEQVLQEHKKDAIRLVSLEEQIAKIMEEKKSLQQKNERLHFELKALMQIRLKEKPVP